MKLVVIVLFGFVGTSLEEFQISDVLTNVLQLRGLSVSIPDETKRSHGRSTRDASEFEVADALVEVFHPRGLRVSIPDREGIKLFAFHGKVNEEMNGREGGTFSRDILKAKNGWWTFYDPHAQLKVGDTLYYWTYVDYFNGRNKLGYTKDDQVFVVTELRPKEPTAGGGCKPTATESTSKPMCAEDLIFSDNFTTFESNFWTPENKFGGGPDYEFVVYTNRQTIVDVQNGHLRVQPVLSTQLFGDDFVTTMQDFDLGPSCTGVPATTDCVQKSDTAYLILPPVTSAQISTKNKFSFKFGKVEIRAKLPKGDWIYPQLFLNPVNEAYGPGYASGQIRVAFLPGNADSDRMLQGGCVLGSSRPGRNYALKTIRKNFGSWSDNFHKFTLIWKPDQITLSVDDMIYGHVYPPQGGFVTMAQSLELGNVHRWRTGSLFAPFDKEMYLVLGAGVGGHCFEDRDDGSKPWQNLDPKAQKNFYKALKHWHRTWGNGSVLDVDYVKVWAI